MGIPIELYIGNTPYFTDEKRGIEIQNWIDNNWNNEIYNNFVILDDDSDMEHLMNHLVKTNNNLGLQDSDVEKAKIILGKTYENCI